MNKLILAGAAALAIAVPAVAQDMAVDSDGNVYVMTAEQQSAYDAWPPDRQAWSIAATSMSRRASMSCRICSPFSDGAMR